MALAELLAEGGSVILIMLSLVQIAPIKINPWSWLSRRIGRAINGEVIEKVDKLGGDLRLLRDECEEREATTCRTRIMRFGDEILHGEEHSKEHFDQILVDIKSYNDYCEHHEHYRNHIAVATINRIETVYAKCLKENSFL